LDSASLEGNVEKYITVRFVNNIFVKILNIVKKDILEDVTFIVLMDFVNLETIASLGMNTNILNLQPKRCQA
jgi:hypothetical protein